MPAERSETAGEELSFFAARLPEEIPLAALSRETCVTPETITDILTLRNGELSNISLSEQSGLSAEISRLRREGVLVCRKHHFELL